MQRTGVAPLAGAWIEIVICGGFGYHCPSLPSRERGLKCAMLLNFYIVQKVAPLAGAWIEIFRLLDC